MVLEAIALLTAESHQGDKGRQPTEFYDALHAIGVFGDKIPGLPARVLHDGIVVVDIGLGDGEEIHLIVPGTRLKERTGVEAGESKA
jgi:hypothetical protein